MLEIYYNFLFINYLNCIKNHMNFNFIYNFIFYFSYFFNKIKNQNNNYIYIKNEVTYLIYF